MKKNTLAENLPDYLDQLAVEESGIAPPPELRRRVVDGLAQCRSASKSPEASRVLSADGRRGFFSNLALRLGGWRNIGLVWGPTRYSVAIVALVAGVLLTAVGLRHLPSSWDSLVKRSAREGAAELVQGDEADVDLYGQSLDPDYMPVYAEDLLLDGYEDSDGRYVDTVAYFPPDADLPGGGSAVQGAGVDHFDRFDHGDGGAGTFSYSGPYPGVRLDPAGFEYLIYVEVPADQLAPWDPHYGGALASVAGADEPDADAMTGRGMARIVVGDDGLVRAVQIPARASRPGSFPEGLQNN
ncbi:MAG: hypothetical protein EBZ36_05645 [Acidobacteria bacterium]|nr:hypothetical protein [Acidobacteriota bacterium]